MAIDTWLPAVLGYLIPVGLFLLAWGGMEPQRARRAATLGSLVLALGAVGYYVMGFAFHLGGARAMAPQAVGLDGLAALWGPSADWGIVGLRGFFLAGKAGTPEALALYVTYLPMVTAAVLLVAMSLSGRARGWQVTCVGWATACVFFPLAACWAWGRGWLAQLWHSANLGHGFVDYAGSGVVYLVGGLGALGALVGLGKRLPESPRGVPEDMPPAHFPLLANLGALLFGLGWLGWSLSEPFHVAGAQIDWPRVATNGLLAGAGAILAAQFYCWLTVGHAQPLMAARGAAAGFIAVSAGAPFIPIWGALVAGLIAGFLVPLGVYVVERKLRLPDETASLSLGTVAGLIGLLAVPLLADGQSGQGWNGQGMAEYLAVPGQGVTGYFPAAGFRGGGNGQLIAQLAGIGALGLLAFLGNWVLMLLCQLPYRPRRERAVAQAVAASTSEGEPEVEPDVAAVPETRTSGRPRGKRGWRRAGESSPNQASLDEPVANGLPPVAGAAEPEDPAASPDTAQPQPDLPQAQETDRDVDRPAAGEDHASQIAELWNH